MGFRDDLNAFSAKVEHVEQSVFEAVADRAYESITVGSAMTGAPGQPVDTGALIASFVQEWPDDNTALIQTDLVYAPIIEDGIRSGRPITIRSAVGGTHSLALTVAGFGNIVEQTVAEMSEGGS